MTQKRNIDDVAEALRKAKGRQSKATLFLGAGCSLTGGIPLAGGIVEDIKAGYRRAYDRAHQRAIQRWRNSGSSLPEPLFPSYPDCMAELETGDQRDLLKGTSKTRRSTGRMWALPRW